MGDDRRNALDKSERAVSNVSNFTNRIRALFERLKQMLGLRRPARQRTGVATPIAEATASRSLRIA